jgi:hypothetical protein
LDTRPYASQTIGVVFRNYSIASFIGECLAAIPGRVKILVGQSK